MSAKPYGVATNPIRNDVADLQHRKPARARPLAGSSNRGLLGERRDRAQDALDNQSCGLRVAGSDIGGVLVQVAQRRAHPLNVHSRSIFSRGPERPRGRNHPRLPL